MTINEGAEELRNFNRRLLKCKATSSYFELAGREIKDTYCFYANLLFANEGYSARDAVNEVLDVKKYLPSDTSIFEDSLMVRSMRTEEDFYKLYSETVEAWQYKKTYIIVNDDIEALRADAELLKLCSDNDIELFVPCDSHTVYLTNWRSVTNPKEITTVSIADTGWGSVDDAAFYSTYTLRTVIEKSTD